MAFLQCHCFSEVLGCAVTVHVLLPEQAGRLIGMKTASRRKKHPVLYLLHGLSDDQTIWMRRTSIERYAAPLGLAVVMSAVERSFYADMKSGPRYFTFLAEELPALMAGFFPVSTKRQDTFAAGLSMGGYGAFKLALTHPDRYAAVASLSGALDMVHRYKNTDPEYQRDLELAFGSVRELAGSRNDLLALAQKLARSRQPRPALFQCCGTDDFLYEDNQRFRRYAEKLRLPLHYEEGPGEHEWGYWDRMIQKVLEWLPIR